MSAPSPSVCRKGFSFIEVLIVMVVFALLVAIAIPRYRNQKERGVIASMQSDLRNLATAEEGYFYVNNVYTQNLALLNNQVTAGNTLVVNEATNVGWSATASSSTTSIRCYIFHGSATPVGSAASEGAIDCS
ncbi:MAG: type IV pilin protein [Gemmatimonadales bacterium]